MAKKSRGLTAKQERFVAEYLIDLNATQAAIRAGYSRKSSERIGHGLLKKSQVFASVQKAREKIAGKLEVTAEKIVREYARIAFSDMRRFATWGADSVNLIDSKELTEDEARCVSELSQTTSKDGGSIKFKLHDKKGALDSLAKHLGMFIERTETGPAGTFRDYAAKSLRFDDEDDTTSEDPSQQAKP